MPQPMPYPMPLLSPFPPSVEASQYDALALVKKTCKMVSFLVSIGHQSIINSCMCTLVHTIWLVRNNCTIWSGAKLAKNAVALVKKECTVVSFLVLIGHQSIINHVVCTQPHNMKWCKIGRIIYYYRDAWCTKCCKKCASVYNILPQQLCSTSKCFTPSTQDECHYRGGSHHLLYISTHHVIRTQQHNVLVKTTQ